MLKEESSWSNLDGDETTAENKRPLRGKPTEPTGRRDRMRAEVDSILEILLASLLEGETVIRNLMGGLYHGINRVNQIESMQMSCNDTSSAIPEFSAQKKM